MHGSSLPFCPLSFCEVEPCDGPLAFPAVQAEEALKQAVFDKALPTQHLEMGPAQRVWELLRAPFAECKVSTLLSESMQVAVPACPLCSVG